MGKLLLRSQALRLTAPDHPHCALRRELAGHVPQRLPGRRIELSLDSSTRSELFAVSWARYDQQYRLDDHAAQLSKLEFFLVVLSTCQKHPKSALRGDRFEFHSRRARRGCGFVQLGLSEIQTSPALRGLAAFILVSTQRATAHGFRKHHIRVFHRRLTHP